VFVHIAASILRRLPIIDLNLFSLDEEVTAIDPIQVLEERFMHQYEVFIDFEIIDLSCFKYHVVKTFIVDVIW
jgi:hypothetical protein